MLLPYLTENEIEAGCDEAGRGCLAGPVFAAAVILPKDFYCEDLDDSKKLSAKQRYKLRPYIKKQALDWKVSQVTNVVIDKINILQATYKAMHQAIDRLKIKPTHLLIDGNRFKAYKNIPHTCIVKGDSKYSTIAAASILAKTYRDDFMIKINKKYPNYNWTKNKGYPTKEHFEQIEKFGIIDLHRKTFLKKIINSVL